MEDGIAIHKPRRRTERIGGRRSSGRIACRVRPAPRRQDAIALALDGASAGTLQPGYRGSQGNPVGASLPRYSRSPCDFDRAQIVGRIAGTTGPAQGATTLCLDEFPYLVASDPSLPSILQRWLDHHRPANFLLILAGSSTRMMNNLFLNRSAPLYGRARKLLHVEPMNYGAFCATRRLNPADQESFTRFAMVGGIPKYWEFVDAKASAIDLADELFFGFAPYLDQEPWRVLRDEGISGVNAISVLEAIGRGAEKPSAMAARLGTVQTNLSRLLQQLLDASVLIREIPFGESLRSTKKTLYSIHDPALRFWFRVYSPHRTRWHRYGHAEKAKLLHDHASTVFEDFCRQRHAEASRYWEGDLEFDFVRIDHRGTGRDKAVVTEVKWKRLTAGQRAEVVRQLAADWQRSALSARFKDVAFEVLDATALRESQEDS